MPRYGGSRGAIKRLKPRIAKTRGIPSGRAERMAIKRSGLAIRPGKEKPGFYETIGMFRPWNREPGTHHSKTVEESLRHMKKYDPKLNKLGARKRAKRN